MILSAAAATGLEITNLLQYGVLGVVAVLFLTGRIVPGRQLEKREEEIARLQAELDERARVAEERMIPALVEATRVLAAYLDTETRRQQPQQQPRQQPRQQPQQQREAPVDDADLVAAERASSRASSRRAHRGKHRADAPDER